MLAAAKAVGTEPITGEHAGEPVPRSGRRPQFDSIARSVPDGRAALAAEMVPLPTLTDDQPAVRQALAALTLAERANWMHGLPKRDMAKLWEDGQPLLLSEMVGAEGEIIRHEGQNDLLPFFDRFEKHVVGRGGGVQGINVQKFSWLVGPGHFSVRQEGEEVWFDYTTVPTSIPDGWPAIVPNDKGLSTLVYGNMIDRVRAVTPGFVVGKVFRHGKPENHYFALIRR